MNIKWLPFFLYTLYICYNVPQKLTTTVCFIQKESSGGRFLLDETDCCSKLGRLRYNLYILLRLYDIEHSFALCN